MRVRKATRVLLESLEKRTLLSAAVADVRLATPPTFVGPVRIVDLTPATLNKSGPVNVEQPDDGKDTKHCDCKSTGKPDEHENNKDHDKHDCVCDGEEEEEDRLPTTDFGTPDDGTGGVFDETALPLTTGSWTFIGPSVIPQGQTSGSQPVSGRIAALVGHPTDPNTLYIAAAGGGIWKSTNAGTSWTSLTDSQSTLFMGSIAIAPSNPSIIYAGTGEANNSVDSYYGRGVLKSTDGGSTWTLLGNSVFDRRAIAQIVVDPTDANIVYAAVGGFPSRGFSGNRGIWKSTDGGVNWTNTTASVSAQNFSDLVIDPTNPQILYCAVGPYFGDATSGVYKTTNAGASWAAAGNFVASTGGSIGRIALAISKSTPSTLYAAVTNSSSYALQKIVVTTDSGATWAATAAQPANYMGGQGWYDTTIAVDPTNSQVVYVAGAASSNHVSKTTNGGASWSSIGTGANGNGPHVDHHGIGFDASGRLLDGNDGGIWRLDNPNVGSILWTDLNTNLGTLQYQGIAIHPTNASIAFGGTQDNGTSKYTGTTSWTLVEGGDGGDVAISKTNSSRVYHIAPVASFGSSAFFRRSDNGGTSWASKTTGISSLDSSNFYPPFVLDPNSFGGNDRLLLGTNNLYQTTNNADSWSLIGGSGFSGWSASSNVNAIAVAPSDVNTIYVTAGGTTLVTTNGGSTWATRNVNSTNHVADMLVDPTNAQIAYAVIDVFGTGHVYRTTNAGVSWTNISANLPDTPVNAIEMDPRNAGSADDVLYIGTDTSVYTSTNLGTSWSVLGTGLPNSIVLDLEFVGAPLNILAAGTHGRSVWEIGTDVPGSVAGQVFKDMNGDGTLNGTDTATNGVTVYLDNNNNGILDGGDVSTTTTGSGNYSFGNITSGTTVNVRYVPLADTLTTTASLYTHTISNGLNVTGDNFGYFPVVFTGSTGDDVYLLQHDASNPTTGIAIFEKLNGGATIQYTILKSRLDTAGLGLRFDLLAGDDRVTITATVSTPAPLAGLTINGGAESTATADRIIITGSANADTIDISNSSITYNSRPIAYSGIESITDNAGAGNDIMNFNGPSTPTVFNGNTGADTLSIHAGTYPFSIDAIAGTSALSVNIDNGGAATFDATQHLAGLVIETGSSATMTTSGNRFLQTKSLTLNGTARLDLNDNDLLVDYTGAAPFTTTHGYIVTGLSSSQGITSTIRTNTAAPTLHALFDNAPIGLTEWPLGSGNPIDSTTLVGKYTWFGDVNLDGIVNDGDYGIVDANFNAAPPTNVAILFGDANMDGTVNGGDYGLIDANYGSGVGNPL